jgi:hypothetical protein
MKLLKLPLLATLAAVVFVIMEGVWLTIYVRRGLWRHAMVWE